MTRRAEIRQELNPHTGGMRLRCEGCGKVAYATEEAARHAADRIFATQNLRMDVYLGPACDWWHLTRSEHVGPGRFYPWRKEA